MSAADDHHVHRHWFLALETRWLTSSRASWDSDSLGSPWYLWIRRKWLLNYDCRRRASSRWCPFGWLYQHQRYGFPSNSDLHAHECIGTCLTITEFDGTKSFKVGIAPETLRRTNLNQLSVGSKVNLERAVAGHVRFGGHFVQVHSTGFLEGLTF